LSVSRFLTYAGFAAWVSVCAAAPEFIWQGLLLLISHFTLQHAYPIFLIGLILTVFVEPLLERARDGRWTPEHRNRRSLLFTAPIALIFGMVAVGLHESMLAYLADGHPQSPEGIRKAVALILEWASIPLAVTLAWFGARLNGWLPAVVAIAAAVWIVSMVLLFAWPLHDVLITAIPCITIIPLGQRYIRQNWQEHTFRNLAIGLAGFTAAWQLLTLLIGVALRMMGTTDYSLYSSGGFWEDFRFYLGWAIGLALAPNPVPVQMEVADHN